MKTPKTRKAICSKVLKAVVPVPPSKPRFVLRLFVAGATDRSRQAILRARELCGLQLKNCYQLEVIDIYQQPALARTNQIVATPTLLIDFPPPPRRFVGDLTNLNELFVELDRFKKGTFA